MDHPQDLDIVEAAYDLEATESAWLTCVTDLAARVYGAPMGAFSYAYRIGADDTLELGDAVATDGLDLDTLVAGTFGTATPDIVRSMLRFSPSCGSLADAIALSGASASLHPIGKQIFEDKMGASDVFVLSLRGLGDARVHINFPASRVLGRTSDGKHERWARISSHLSAGLRLRQTLSASVGGRVEAVLDPTGKVQHAEGPATAETARDALSSAVRQSENARRRSRTAPIDVWQGLVDGRWTLVERLEQDGKRYLVARENEPALVDPRRWTRRERQVGALLARGASSKLIAYDLGVSVPSVGRSVSAIMRKVGAKNRTELIVLLRSLPVD